MAEMMLRGGTQVRAWAAARPGAVDGAFAALLTAVSLPPLWQLDEEVVRLGYEGPTPVVVGVLLVTTLPLAWRRRAPLTIMVVIAAAYLAAALMAIPALPFGLLVGVHSLTAYGSRRAVMWGTLVVTATILVGLGMVGGLQHLLTNLLVLGAAGLFGDWQRLQRARARELARQGQQLQRARQDLTRLAVEQERQRIAAELRDVLAHAVTAMITQARAARRLAGGDAVRAHGPLQAIEDTGRAALVELRRLVGLLRDDPTAFSPLDEDVPERVPRHRAADSVEADRSWLEIQRRTFAALSPATRDLLLVLLVAAVELSLQLVYHEVDDGAAGLGGPGFGSMFVAAILSGALLLRRRFPQPVLAFVLAGTAVNVLLTAPTMFIAVLVALYTVASRCPRPARLAWLAVTLVVAGWLLLPEGTGYLAGQLLFAGGAWLLGDRQRVARRYELQLEERRRQLEQAQQREVALGVAFERTRLARELHDVVGNSIGVMLVQARGAGRTLPRDPRRADEALEQVLACGQESLVRLREVLPTSGDDEGGGLMPQPGVEDLPGLVEELRVAGLSVELQVEGMPLPISPGVGLSAYRIVQEALTNVLKHAAADHALVRVTHGHTLVLEVTDDGRNAGAAADDLGLATIGGGHGLIGMAERVRLVGGELEVGRWPGGDGFRVLARLPLTAPDARDDASSELVHP